MRRVLLILTAVLLLSQGQAQELSVSNFLDIEQWVTALEEDAAAYRDPIFTAAYALALLAFLVGVYQALTAGSADGLKGSLVRLAVAGALLTAAPWLTGEVKDTWELARAWSAAGVEVAIDEAAASMDSIGTLTAPLMLGAGVVKGMAVKVGTAATARAAGGAALKGTVASIGRWLNGAMFIIMPIVVFVYSLIVMTGLAILLANMLFPIAAAMLVFSGRMGGLWLGNYLRVALGAFLTVILLPLGFGAAVELAIVRPAQSLADGMAAATAEFEAAGAELEAYQEEVVAEMANAQAEYAAMEGTEPPEEDMTWNPMTWPAGFANIAKENWNKLTNLVTTMGDVAHNALLGVFDFLRGWVMGLAMLMIGAVLAIYILMRLETYLIALMGGVAGGVMHRMRARSGGNSRVAGAGARDGGRIERTGSLQTRDVDTNRLPPAARAPAQLPGSRGAAARQR